MITNTTSELSQKETDTEYLQWGNKIFLDMGIGISKSLKIKEGGILNSIPQPTDTSATPTDYWLATGDGTATQLGFVNGVEAAIEEIEKEQTNAKKREPFIFLSYRQMFQ